MASDLDRPQPYRFRFAVAYLALAVVAGAAVGAAALLLDRPPTAATETWSEWRPEGRTSSFPRQIAEYVAPRYRLPSGSQLAGVLAGPAEVQDLPIRAVLIQHESSTPTQADETEVVETGDSIMYTLCGSGPRCSIAEGKPSAERQRLLRREALELALYTFRYVEGVETVIALLPVNLGKVDDPNDDTSVALFLRKGEFARQLRRPLRETLLSPAPPLPDEIDAQEGLVIDRLTRPRTFLYEFVPTQDASAILRLAPVVA